MGLPPWVWDLDPKGEEPLQKSACAQRDCIQSPGAMLASLRDECQLPSRPLTGCRPQPAQDSLKDQCVGTQPPCTGKVAPPLPCLSRQGHGKDLHSVQRSAVTPCNSPPGMRGPLF